MRKSYDGLAALVESRFGENPLGGDFFVFANKARDRLKILFWDSGGLCLFCKRLEAGRFRFPADGSALVERAVLAMILEGIDVKNIRRLNRYIPK